MQTNADKGRGFDCMQMSASQYPTKACGAGVRLHGVSCHPYSDGSGCIKRTTQVAECLLSMALGL